MRSKGHVQRAHRAGSRRRIALRLASCLLLMSAPAGCSFTPKVTSEVSPDIGKYSVKSVVVLPFDALRTPQVTERLFDEVTAPQGAKRSDISVSEPPVVERQAPQEARVPPSAAEKATRAFLGKLKNLDGLVVYSPDDAAAALAAVAAGGAGPAARAAKVAAHMSLDAAIVGRVLVYQERKGSRLGGDTAAVGFEVKLVSVDGTVLWSGNYYEKQKPLTEDARGSLERGFAFVTADELIEYGAARLADRFPFGAKANR